MKRRIALLTALFVLISALSALAQGFSDMPTTDSRYYDAFKYAIEKKLISGDGTNLNPNNYITQAEALTIISRIKPFNCAETDITVYGVSKDKWYYSTVAKAYTAGYVTADTLSPEIAINRISANAIIGRVFDKTPTPWPNNELCTRADFIFEIYLQAPDGKYANIQTPTETAPTEAVSEAPTEFTDLRAQAAQEAMQLALGILPDGSSYTNVVVYKDTTHSDWASGKVSSSSSSSRPSRPSRPDDDEEEPTQAPTEDNTTPVEPETQPPTDAPTEPETQEPTYGEYDGPIDNDKDNVIDDPFNDGWRPPGWVGGDDDNDDDGNDGGWDAEDEDFNINDDDDPDYQPETTPTENEIQAPTDEETQVPTDEETQAPSDEETQAPSDEETQAPSDEETQAPSDAETQAPSDEETQAPSDEETQAPSDEETQAPSDEETQAPSDDETEPNEDPCDITDSEEDSNTGTDDGTSTAFAWIFSKDWWFD